MKFIFERMRLAPRLGLAFGLILLVAVVANATGIWRLQTLRGIADDLGGPSAERAILARELHAIVVLSSMRAETLLEVDDKTVVARINADRKATSARSEVVRKRLQELASDERSKAQFAAIDSAGDRFRDVRNGLVKRKEAGERLAPADVQNVLQPVADAYARAVDEFALYQQECVAAARSNAASSASTGVAILAAGALLVGVLGLGFAWSLARSIIEPLQRAAHRAGRVAAGDLSTPEVDDLRRDEIQSLLAGLSTMQSRLAGLVASVKDASESIGCASTEIAIGNQDLSTRTEHAASNLQQTASSMEQLTSAVRQSADAARQADQLASAAAQVAARGGEVVSQVVSTMDEINESSRRIADITSVIDGIAFQTNILSLNAAVEAARAGEQGRGFAVVAGEVRTLAQRSAQAAKEIKELIAASVSRVETGSRLVADAGRTMSEIVGSVQRVTDIIGEISSATAEQSDGIGQVNTAVTQLDQMTQQNAALVEQSTAATEGLKQQAGHLSGLIGTFKLAA